MLRVKLFLAFQFMSFYSLFMPDDSFLMVEDHLKAASERNKKAALDKIFKDRDKNKDY